METCLTGTHLFRHKDVRRDPEGGLHQLSAGKAPPALCELRPQAQHMIHQVLQILRVLQGGAIEPKLNATLHSFLQRVWLHFERHCILPEVHAQSCGQ